MFKTATHAAPTPRRLVVVLVCTFSLLYGPTIRAGTADDLKILDALIGVVKTFTDGKTRNEAPPVFASRSPKKVNTLVTVDTQLPNCIENAPYTGCWGTFTFPDEYTFVGEWLNDKRHGIGTSVAPDGSQYFGTWRDGRPYQLIKFGVNGLQLEAGEYDHNYRLLKSDTLSPQRLASSARVFQNPSVPLDCPFLGQKNNCNGRATLKSGIVYEGLWVDGEPHGKGKSIFPDGRVYVGVHKRGRFEGEGTLKDSSGRVIKSGIWKDDKYFGSLNASDTTNAAIIAESKDTSTQQSISTAESLAVLREGRAREALERREMAKLAAEEMRLQQLKVTSSEAQVPITEVLSSQSGNITHIKKPNRVALVIGNAAYKSSPLANPVNDAQDMAKSLRALSFDVVERTNITSKQIGRTLRAFRTKIKPGDVALVFYAGHGLQINGQNYLPAVDADILGEEDVPNQSLSTLQIMDVLADSGSSMNLVFLDACRDNPYARGFRSATRGLSRENAPSGTLISYATRPGSVAADGTGRNGLYTSVLLKAMEEKNQPIEQVLKQVVRGVTAASNGAQEPWMEGSLVGDFCFGSCSPSFPVLANSATPSLSAEEIFWQSIRESDALEELTLYLERYPSGTFAELAKLRIEKILDASSRPNDVSFSVTGTSQNVSGAGNFPKDKLDKRTLAVTWEGFGLLAGVINISEQNGKGTVKVTLPSGEDCAGEYVLSNRAAGKWTLKCESSTLTASGEFIARGDGQGSEGNGRDNLGRSLSYVVGPRAQ
jgi:hypothetical protein